MVERLGLSLEGGACTLQAREVLGVRGGAYASVASVEQNTLGEYISGLN